MHAVACLILSNSHGSEWILRAEDDEEDMGFKGKMILKRGKFEGQFRILAATKVPTFVTDEGKELELDTDAEFSDDELLVESKQEKQ